MIERKNLDEEIKQKKYEIYMAKKHEVALFKVQKEKTAQLVRNYRADYQNQNFERMV